MITLKQLASLILLLALAIMAVPFATAIIFQPASAGMLSTATTIASAAFPLWVIGCCLYAHSIGHHFLWGLLGAFPLGFLILIFFPTRKATTP